MRTVMISAVSGPSGHKDRIAIRCVLPAWVRFPVVLVISPHTPNLKKSRNILKFIEYMWKSVESYRNPRKIQSNQYVEIYGNA